MDQVEAFTPEREALWARLQSVTFITDDEKRTAAGYGPALSSIGPSAPRRRPFQVDVQKYAPDQPRVPAGNSDGGQWTGGGGGSGTDSFSGGDGEDQLAQAPRGRGSISVRIGGQQFEATPSQVQRLSNATGAANAATARVREIDPRWRPNPSVYESAEGAIRAREAEAAEAEARFAALRRDAIPGTSHAWAVNRLTKELYERGYRLVGPTNSPGREYENPATGERVRIMERPGRRYSTETDQKHNNDYYYRYRPGRGKGEGDHVTIPSKPRSE